MESLKMKVINEKEQTLTISRSSGGGIAAVHTQAYRDGDRIAVDTNGTGGLYWVCLDEAIGTALLYLDGSPFNYPIPKADNRACFSPKAFSGSIHLMHMTKADEREASQRRNLALNPYDHHTIAGFFPHATANVETRNELTFAARNAIDGIFENASHGEYPYQSWGINRDPKAALTIDFGRPVVVDEVRLTLRADFPHDSWWEEATVTFSDDSSVILPLTKSALGQSLRFEARTITALTLHALKKADDPSPFPALTQIEVFGFDA